MLQSFETASQSFIAPEFHANQSGQSNRQFCAWMSNDNSETKGIFYQGRLSKEN